MCGRYAQGRAIPELLARYAQLGLDSIAAEQGFQCFNIAPSMLATVIFRDGANIRVGPMRWGFVPHWAKSLAELKQKPINARSETADTGPMFRDAFKSARCLVPATGFFEWQGSRPPKQPFYIRPVDQEIYSFAGLWSRWRDPGGVELATFCILTTEANAVVKPIHDRMPCILRPEEETDWLSPSQGVAKAKSVLSQYPSDKTTAHPVSNLVNKPGNDCPELITPIAKAFHTPI